MTLLSRRHADKYPIMPVEKIRNIDVSRLGALSFETGTPPEDLISREEGDKRNDLIKDVRGKAARLFGLQIQTDGTEEGSPVAPEAEAPEANVAVQREPLSLEAKQRSL